MEHTLIEMISRRRSVRAYRPEALDASVLANIRTRMEGLIPLFPEKRLEAYVIDRSQANLLQKWKTPHFMALFTDDSPEGLMNAGFMYQQMELYLQSIGLGSCWVGLSSLNDGSVTPPGLKLAVMMAFGIPDDVPLRNAPEGFHRKSLAELADRPDDRLEPLRLAPSATNCQPWYVTHEGAVLRLWQIQWGPIRARTLRRCNHLDQGIGLAHLYLTQPGFAFFREAEEPKLAGYRYVGSIRL